MSRATASGKQRTPGSSKQVFCQCGTGPSGGDEQDPEKPKKPSPWQMAEEYPLNLDVPNETLLLVAESFEGARDYFEGRVAELQAELQ
jgi:hypothetical protein